MQEARTVSITGQVRDPGELQYREGMTIRDLLMQGGGLADAEYQKQVFMDRADLYRVSDDGSEERVLPFHLGDAIEGDGMAARPLEPGDEIRVYPSTVERLEERFVNVAGAVKEPGEYPFRDNLTLKDVILQAGGFAEGASLREVEVTRMVRSTGADRQRARTLRVPLAGEDRDTSVSFSVRDTTRVLERAAAFQLQHRDRVFVRTDPQFQPQETVAVQGEVRFPGEYTLLRDNERLSSVLERAGGVLPTGYLKGGRLLRTRKREPTDTEREAGREESQPSTFGRERVTEQVIVEMAQALDGELEDDVILQPGDKIIIPTQPNTVAIRGNVANEGLVKHAPGERVDYYLERAGGVREDTEAVFLTQASGATFRINTGWFRRTPIVDDGATIRVQEEPPKEEKDGVDISQTITEVTGVLSSALTIVVLATRAFN
jgi:protein involved in polysaccharide export with SLBB domain